MTAAWHDLAGGVGVSAIIVSYLLLVLGKLGSGSLVYGLSNAVGAALILVSLRYDFNFSAALVESFWLLVSLIGIVRGLLKNASGSSDKGL